MATRTFLAQISVPGGDVDSPPVLPSPVLPDLSSRLTLIHRAEYTEYSSELRWIVLVAVMLGTILEVLDTSIVNVALPEMMGNLGATLSQVSWVSTGYIIANVIVLPMTGWLSSRLGRKQYLGASIVLFTAASFFCGISRTLDALILFRVLQGAGGAALLSTAQATIMEVFPPEQHGMVAGIFGIGVMVGPTVGPTLGGWITDNYSWPWIFFINIPIGCAAAILTLLYVRDSSLQGLKSEKIDFIGVALLAVGLGSFQTVLEEGNRDGWLESSFICWMVFFALAGILLCIAWELHTDSPVIDLRVLRNRGLAAGAAFGGILGFGMYGGIFLVPVFLQNIRHYTAMQAGWALFPGGVAMALVMPIVGKLVTRIPTRTVAGIGVGIFILSMWMLHFVTSDTGPDDLFVGLVLRGIALGFMFVPGCLAALAGLEGKALADGSGMFNLTRQLGGSAGIAFLSTLLDHRGAFHRTMLVQHVNIYNPMLQDRLFRLQRLFEAKGASSGGARLHAFACIDNWVEGQAAVLSFADAFLMISFVFLLAVPLVLAFKKSTAESLSVPH